MKLPHLSKKHLLLVAVAVVVAGLAWFGWSKYADRGPGDGFVSGNGRIEATEIDVATKSAGRLREVLVKEGEFVHAGQPLAQMDTATLKAQREEAVANLDQAKAAIRTAEFTVAQRRNEYESAQAQVAAQVAERDAARKQFVRTQILADKGLVSQQTLDDARASIDSKQATIASAKAKVAAAQAAVETAVSQVTSSRSSVDAATATIARIDADIADSTLVSPRDGRVQVRVAQPGEVLAAGGRVLNLLDLSDVYMTFFVPETAAGRIALGSDARIVLDAAPGTVIPATVSFVASQAQFTPKTVETASERQKLMFRVRAQIPPDLLKRYIEQVKTGMPGVAWLKLDANAQWPASLQVSPALQKVAKD
ncbi:MAG: efflux RND transporter periplasmic adaptor subunit [Proteobacteria bacterium]|nr:efflux RND transporter periplasmic adaptor subunit [Pseudomonadota bacterium]